MTPYEQLSRPAQLYREKQLAETALARYRVVGAKLSLLTHNYNTVYRVDAPTGRYVLRIQQPNLFDAPTIASELAWLRAIRQDTELSVPEPLANDAGELLTTLTHPEMPWPRHIALFRWMDGRIVGKATSPAALRQVGALMAALHQHAQRWQPPAGFTRPRWDWERIYGPNSALADGRMDSLLTDEDRATFMQAGEIVRQAMAELGESNADFGLIHFDMHRWNLLNHAGEIKAIDFEICGWGHWLLDIAVTLEASHGPVEGRASEEKLQQAFLAGYTEVRPLPRCFAKMINVFIAARLGAMANWTVETSNPALRINALDDLAELAGEVRKTLGI